MPLQDIANGLIADRIAQLGQGTGNAIIPPAAILLGQAHDQGFQLLVDHGAIESLTLLGTVKCLRHQLAVPGHNGVGFDDGGDLLQGFLAQLLTHRGQDLALAIAQSHVTSDLLAQDTILSDQVLIPQEELLVHRIRDIRQPLFPIHASFHLRGRLLH